MALIKCKECGGEVSSKARACPKCGAAPQVSNTVRYGGGFLGGIVIIAMASSLFSDKEPRNQKSVEPPAELVASESPTKPVTTDYAQVHIEASADEIANLYNKNTVAADDKYKGKRIEVRAVVDSINTDFSDDVYIVLRGGGNQFQYPRAVLSDSEHATAAELSKGQKIKVLCTGDGDVMKSAMLKDCSIAR